MIKNKRKKNNQEKSKNFNANTKFVMLFMNKFYQNLLNIIQELLELWTFKIQLKLEKVMKNKKMKNNKLEKIKRNQNLKREKEATVQKNDLNINVWYILLYN